MGCCHSNCHSPDDDGDDAPPRYAQAASADADNANVNDNVPGVARDPPRAAVNQRARSRSNVGSAHASSVAPPPSTLPNQPIRAPTPLAQSPSHLSHRPPPWTRSQLDAEREAFFHTRVAGRRDVWDALKTVCGMVREGNLADAQGILDAMNLTCPNGRIASGRSGRDRVKGGVYDDRGELYDVPRWVLTDPEDIIADGGAGGNDGAEEEKHGIHPAAAAATGPDSHSLSSSDDNDDNTSTHRSEKGKGRAPDLGEPVQVRARLSDRGTDVVVRFGTKQPLTGLTAAVRDQIGRHKRVRLMYLGKALDERSTLEQSGWQAGHVINCLVFDGDEEAAAEGGGGGGGQKGVGGKKGKRE